MDKEFDLNKLDLANYLVALAMMCVNDGTDNCELTITTSRGPLKCNITFSPAEEEILNWEEVKGILTPGGDPMYICPVCRDKNSRHINGIETSRHLDKCPVCGAKLKYPYEKETK